MKRMSIWMLVSLLAVSASAQKITTQQETIDCGQVLFRNPVTAEFPFEERRQQGFAHQPGAARVADAQRWSFLSET